MEIPIEPAHVLRFHIKMGQTSDENVVAPGAPPIFTSWNPLTWRGQIHRFRAAA